MLPAYKNKLIKAIFFNLSCISLLLKNLFLFKKLNVKYIALNDKIVIESNLVQLYWDVKGCHKIKISGVGWLKGNISGIRFKLFDVSKPIEVIFYGTRKKEKRLVKFYGQRVSLLNKFYSKSNLPASIEVIQNKFIIENTDNFKVDMQVENAISNTIIQTEIEEINFEFYPFDINNYEQEVKQYYEKRFLHNT